VVYIRKDILKETASLGLLVIEKAMSFYDQMKITDMCTFSESSNKKIAHKNLV